jgi:hypothetical protein
MYDMYMTSKTHRAIIHDDLIAELCAKKIIKMNRDGRTEMISHIANVAIKDMLKRKKGSVW